MSYSVNGIAGGNTKVGLIDSNGLYTAPALVPSPSNLVTITGVSSLFPTQPHSVSVSVLNPIPVITAITPSSFSEGTATVTVTGSQFIFGAQIYWNGVAVPTTFVSGTELAASIAAPNPGTYPLTVSNPDPGSAFSSQAMVKVAPGQVVLTAQTSAGTTVRVGNSIPITINVTGTTNTAVNWMVNGIAGGNSTVGTITCADELQSGPGDGGFDRQQLYNRGAGAGERGTDADHLQQRHAADRDADLARCGQHRHSGAESSTRSSDLG
jgi:hypothetical protein